MERKERGYIYMERKTYMDKFILGKKQGKKEATEEKRESRNEK